MQLSREELDRRLVALDEAMVMLRIEAPDQAALRVAFLASAAGILAVAGSHREYVATRLPRILSANGLDTKEREGSPPAGL